MSSKAKSAVSELFDLLESRYALRVLWALKDGHTQTFRLLQDSVGGVTPNTLNTRLKELRAAGLIDHAGTGYGLTRMGMDLLKRLSDLQAFSNKYASFWGITGAYYLYGAAEMHYARLGLALEPPAGLSEEDRDVFWQLLEEQLFPKYREREASAVKSWQSVLELAGRWNLGTAW